MKAKEAKEARDINALHTLYEEQWQATRVERLVSEAVNIAMNG